MLCQVKLAAAKPVLIQMQHSGDTHVCDTCPFISCDDGLHLPVLRTWGMEIWICSDLTLGRGRWTGVHLIHLSLVGMGQAWPCPPTHPPTHHILHTWTLSFPISLWSKTKLSMVVLALTKTIGFPVVLQRFGEEIDGRTILSWLLTNRFDAVRILVTFGSVGAGIQNKPISGFSVIFLG